MELRQLFYSAAVAAAFLTRLVPASYAAEPCAPVVGELVSAQGTVEVQRAQDARWQAAGVGGLLCARDSVRTGQYSRAAISLVNDAVLRIDESTTVNLTNITPEEKERSFLELVVGAIQSFSRRPRLLAVNTPYLNATIEGTEFIIRVAQARTDLTVFEGVVAAANPHGQVAVTGGQSVSAQAGQAPEPRILVRPRDAVQWALYYPVLLAVLGARTERVPADTVGTLAESLKLAGNGDIEGALVTLDRMPEGERDAAYHQQRAAMLLSVGQVDEARAAIEQAISRDPNAGLAYALRAVIAVVQNHRDSALVDGQRAVELSPRSAAAGIALSYAQQANFELEAARDTLLQATEAEPQNPLAWARLAELWLALGYRDRARDSAERAVELEPNLARTQVVLGFANLTEFRTGPAKQAFEQAIALDSADPLPRLGLGLALIRDGELEEGRHNLEIAVGLDANNALMRSYLGKAYFEEKRAPLDAEQLAIAKELDPLDPTPFLYDAIRKQSENRPGEALDDLQASIEKNENRAVYRGRLQLDQDRATRGTSLARAYGDLGFTQLGVNEASKSLALAPDNAGAHRFLSDNLRSVRRREVARVSELLQAQMLQDINVNPIQPSVSEVNLNIITGGGAFEAGLNEFTPLFERNQIQFDGSTEVGNHDTWSGEGVVTTVHNQFSISAGAFHHETDGWRPNHNISHDIYNIYAQAAITPELNVQAEFRHRDTEFGDLEFDFDRNDFGANTQNEREENIARAGARYSPAPHSDILLSYVFSHQDARGQDSFMDFLDTPFGLIPVQVSTDNPLEQNAHQIEGQYIFSQDLFNVVTGVAYNNVDTEEMIELAFDGVPVITANTSFESDDYRSYVYANINLPASFTWTIGLSYVNYSEVAAPANDVERFNPKLGVQWNVTPDITLRAAFTETVKSPLAANRTLEPTQVAGFNQSFDDANATKSRRYGVGAEWQIVPDVAIGAEATWREIKEPFIDASVTPSQIVEDEAEEELHRVYLYWTPIDELAVSAEVIYDKWEKKSEAFAQRLNSQNPLDVETISVPVGVKYFHPSGFFAGVGVTYVDQEVKRLPQFTNQGEDQFTLVDAAIGFRFPNRSGIVSLQVNNIFDENFNYQDDSFREFSTDPSVGPYFPERIILGRVTLNF
jgi:tetratricopeptide (TPR) repeat protein